MATPRLRLRKQQTSGPPPSGPTAISSPPLTLLANQPIDAIVATMTAIGGTPPYVYAVLGNANLTCSSTPSSLPVNLSTSHTASFSAGVNQTYYLRATDNNGFVYTEPVNSRTITVPAGPTSVTGTLSILDNATVGSSAGALNAVGGTPPYVWTIPSGYGGFFDIASPGSSSQLTLNSGGVGNLTPGSLAGNVQAVDAAGLSTGSISLPITVEDHTAQTLITTFTAVNTSGSATSANANAIMFGHPFQKAILPGGAVIKGSISGTTLTVTSTSKGAVATGQALYGPGITPGTTISSGSGSTWTVSASQTVASTKITLVGQFPLFKQASTTCKFSMGQPALWADGSLKQAAFLVQLPTAIAGSGSATMNIYTNGTKPAASGRALTDISSNTDFTFTGTILHSIVSGEIGQVWAASCNDAITNGTVELYADGTAGRVYVIEGDFKRSGVAHGQLRCRWYVQILQTSAGALYGFRVLARATMPYYDVDTPTKGMRTFSSLVFANGATTIRDMARQWDSAGNPFTFTWSSGNTFAVASGDPIYGTSSGGLAVNLTTTGTLPSPLTSGGGAPYFTKGISPSTPTLFKLGTKTPAVINGSNLVTGTSAGTGTHTMTIVPMLSHFGSLDSAEKTAQYDYVQGSGSVAAETTVRFAMNTAYWISTKIFLPYNTGQGVTNRASQSIYLPSAAGGKSAASGIGNGPDQSLGTTGDIPDLGPMPLQYVSHLLNQDALGELVVRVNGLTDAAFPMNVRNSANNCIPGCNNTVYPGMTSQQTTLRWNGSDAAGFTPAATNVSMVFSGTAGLSLSTDHMPEWSFYPYVFTGEPQYRDTLILKAASALLNRATATVTATPYGTTADGRNITVGATTYYQVFGNKSGSAVRVDAWALRSIAQAAGILSDSIGENPYYKDYFTDIMNDTANQANAYIALCATQNSFVTTMGILSNKGPSADAIEPQFMLGYRVFAVEVAVGCGECAPAITLLEHLCKYNSYLFNNISLYTAAGSYDHIMRLGVGSPVSITGITNANPGVVHCPGISFDDRDIVEIISVGGMTQVNNQTFQVRNINATNETFELYDTSGNPINTTSYNVYTSGGIVGVKFITSLAQWGGSQQTHIGWTNTGSRRFTVASIYAWTNYQPRDGDAYIFPFLIVHAGLQRVPAGLSVHQPIYYAINTSGMSFDLCTTPGDAGTIVLPTDTATVTQGAMVQIVTPTVANTINFPGNAATYWLASGPAHAAAALGISTVDPAFIAALDVQDQAIQTAGKASYAANCKYCMVSNY